MDFTVAGCQYALGIIEEHEGMFTVIQVGSVRGFIASKIHYTHFWDMGSRVSLLPSDPHLRKTFSRFGILQDSGCKVSPRNLFVFGKYIF